MNKRNWPFDIHARCCCTVMQAIIRRLLTAEARANHKYIRAGFLVVKLEPGQVSFRALRFSAVISVQQHSTFIHSFVVRQEETWHLRDLNSTENDSPPASTKHERAYREGIFFLCTLFLVLILMGHYVHSSFDGLNL